MYLPKARTKILCPVATWRYYISHYLPKNTTLDKPILMLNHNDNLTLVTSDQLRHLFNNVFRRAGLESKKYTPHSLRRGGATFMADSNVPIPAIKRHGLWKTEAIEIYLKKMSNRNSPLFNFLKEL